MLSLRQQKRGEQYHAALLILGPGDALTHGCALLQITLAANYFGPVILTVTSLPPAL